MSRISSKLIALALARGSRAITRPFSTIQVCCGKRQNVFSQHLLSQSFSSSITPVDEGNSDLLLTQLNQNKNPQEILKLVSTHHAVMNNKHLVAAFHGLHANSKVVSSEEIMNNANFELLCKQALLRAKFFDLNDTISMLKQFTLLPLSPKSRLVQSYLQMLRNTINDMTLTQIPFVGLLLRMFNQREKTALVDALTLALPMVMQLHLNHQINELGTKILIDCLSFAVFSNLPEDVIQQFTTCLMKKKHLITMHHDALRLLQILIRMKSIEHDWDGLFEHVLDILIRTNHKLSVSQILSALVVCDKRGLILERFFDVIATRMIEEQWELWQICSVLSNFVNVKYINVESLEAIGEVILNNKAALDDDPRISIFNLVEMFALANCVPTNSTEVFDTLCSCKDKIAELRVNSPPMYLSFVSNLVSLRYYPNELIDDLLNPNFLKEVSGNYAKPVRLKNTYEKLLLVNQAVGLNSLETDHLPQDVVRQAITYCQKYQLPKSDLEELFLSTLEQGFGGAQYILSDVWTKNGILINHLIVMRGGKYPMAINYSPYDNDMGGDKICFVENLSLPMDVKLVAVLPINDYSYASNLPRLRSTTACSFKNLEQMGYSVVLVHLSQWNKLLDCEKMPYLMREIHEVVPSPTSASSYECSSNQS